MNLILKSIRNRFCKFSGEDFTIIRLCNSKIQLYFSLIGFLVSAILFSSFASAMYFTDQLFHNLILDIGVGIIWGYIITNMYVLLLYTISPPLLPNKANAKEKIKTNTFKLNSSMILRIFVVMLLAIIIAQPLNVLVLKPDSTAFASDIKLLLNTNIFAIPITLFVIGIFLLPIILKYNIRKFDEFYEIKAKKEKQFILDEYKVFKNQYAYLLKENISRLNKIVSENLKHHLNELEKNNYDSYKKILNEIDNKLIEEKLEKYEYWADSPFRTVRKSQNRNILSEEDLLKHIYSK